MHSAGFEPRGRNYPQPLVAVDFAPTSTGRLVTTNAGQQQEFDHRPEGVADAVGSAPKLFYLGVGHYALPWLLGADQVFWLDHGARRNLDAVVLRAYPIEHAAHVGERQVRHVGRVGRNLLYERLHIVAGNVGDCTVLPAWHD